MLIAKRAKLFVEGEFVKDCVTKMVNAICPEKKQAFFNVCLSQNTMAQRTEELYTDLKRQVSERGAQFDFSH